MTVIRQDHELAQRPDLIDLKIYVENVLGLKLRLKPWEHVKALPYALRDRYEFFITNIFNAQCLILKERPKREASVADVAKHIQAIHNLQAHDKLPETGELMILSPTRFPVMTARGWWKKASSSSCQVINFFTGLWHGFARILSPAPGKTSGPESRHPSHADSISDQRMASPATGHSRPSSSLSYAKMTVTRAIKELTDLDIVKPGKELGEAAILFHLSPKETWEKAKDAMRTPVKKTLWLNAIPEAFDTPMLLAGETALAQMSLLASPKVTHFALTAAQFDRIRTRAQPAMNAAYGKTFGAWGSTSKRPSRNSRPPRPIVKCRKTMPSVVSSFGVMNHRAATSPMEQ